ncbi:HAD like protein [Babesia gibsoni]|uniref:HAD like protein n=1 Tax=Babesia gibsoni TaxID=33632 RepID=A0AAD8LQV3_BABGI|nr:HAD like protein [Babesia gibsoni]
MVKSLLFFQIVALLLFSELVSGNGGTESNSSSVGAGNDGRLAERSHNVRFNSDRRPNVGQIPLEGSIPQREDSGFLPSNVTLKWFATDLDGTFIAHNSVVMRRNIDAFVNARMNGLNVFFCTGRGFNSSINLLSAEDRMNANYQGYPGIYYNGGLVYGPNGGVLRAFHFKTEVVKHILDVIMANNYMDNVIFFTLDHCFIISDNKPYLEQIRVQVGSTWDLEITTIERILSEEILRIAIIDYYNIAESLKHIEGIEFVIKSTRERVTDIHAPEVNKGNGLKVLMDALNLSPSEGAYIGDAENDIEAMALVDYTLAVGNAKDSVKAHAKYVLEETNEEGAFAKVVSLLFGIETD